MKRCPICNRSVVFESEFCAYHHAARKNLEEGFERWRTALNLAWEDYLDRVLELDETGIWVKEVIEFLRTRDGASEP